MDISDRIENIGGSGSAYACGGGIGLFLLAIFLIILFAAFRQHGWGDGTSIANTMGEFHPRENCADKLTWSRYANYMDPEVARNHTEIVRMGGALEKQQAVDTGELKSAIDTQTRDIMLNNERQTNAIIANQNNIAREQERLFYQDKLASLREANSKLENQLLFAQQAREADQRQGLLLADVNSQFCNVNNRITQIQGDMLKAAPCYVSTAPVATFQCGPRSCGCNG